jgi:aspartate racemase
VKTIGVLGGIGPQATMDFETRLHRVAQRLLPPSRNAGYPPMVVYYCRHAPILLNEDGTPRIPLRLDPRLLEAATRLGSLADFLVITSNGVHVFQPEIEQASGRRVLSMLDATLKEVQRRRWKRVGVLTLAEPLIYTDPLARLGIASETVDAELQAALVGAIFQVMEGRDDAASVAVARSAVAALRSRGVEGIILGCTEIPFLVREADDDATLINPLQLLAEAAVRIASMESGWTS